MPAQGGWCASAASNAVKEETNSGYDAIFAGGGVIGLASAWVAFRNGARVCGVERDRPAAGATGVAAGMLAPAGEASWGEEALISLNLESLRCWAGFSEELERASEMEIGFARKGALHVAVDRDEAESLRRRYDLHRQLGLDSEWLTGGASRKLEPGLATGIRGGAYVPGEASVDPRQVVAALLAALDREGVPVHVGTMISSAERVDGSWRLETEDGPSFAGDTLVLSAGC